jgi:arylsulfatase A-like enzyme
MHRREFLNATGAGAVSALFSSGQAPVSERRPNFIVILLDDLGCTDLGCYGARDLKTPNIDALAAAGVRFTNWYSNASVCAPARASLMTGRYPVHAGVPTNGPELPQHQITIARLLKSQGYATGLMGKWHLGTPVSNAPNDHGFDEFYGFHSGCVDFYSHRFYWGEPKRPNYHDLWRNRTEIFEDGEYLTDRITDNAIDFIRTRRTQPFSLYLAYNAPHYPMHAPKKYVQRFADLPFERRVYAAMIAAVDDGIGAVTRELDRLGLANDTLIFFVGDNGATTEPRAGVGGNAATAGSNRPYRGYKFSLFDGGMHVPGIMRWEGTLPAGAVSREVCISMDVLPTISRAAGAALPDDHRIDGQDILGVAAGKTKSPHSAVFWMQGDQLAVRRGKHKLVINGFTAEDWPAGRQPLTGNDAMFLSDLEADPGESMNLRAVYPNLADELATLAHQWKQSMLERAKRGG